MKTTPPITSPYAPDVAHLRAWLEKMIAALRFVEIVAAVVALIARMRDVNTELTKQLAQMRRGRPRSETLDRLERQLLLPLETPSRPVQPDMHKRGWTPDRDWTVEAPVAEPTAIRSGPFVVARVARPTAGADPRPAARIAVLVDTSASRGVRVPQDGERVAAILKALGVAAPQATVVVAAFDQEVETIYTGASAGFGAAQAARLAARGALGATDLRGALRWTAQQQVDRVVLFSDGVPTLGGRTADDLGPDLDALRAAGVKRLDVTTSPDERGAALLEALAARLEDRGAVLGQDDPALALEVLQESGALERDQVMTSRWALGLALARAGKLDEAAGALASTLDSWMGVRNMRNDMGEIERLSGRAQSVLDVLEQELSIVAAAAAIAHPEEKAALVARLAPFGIELANGPSLRFAAAWEADTDVDLQVDSARGPFDPAASSTRDALPGEGIVIDDVKAFGPEEYVVGGAARAYPYRVRVQLRGASASVMGRVDVLEYDAKGHLTVDARPFVVQTEGGAVDVMVVDGHGVRASSRR